MIINKYLVLRKLPITKALEFRWRRALYRRDRDRQRATALKQPAWDQVQELNAAWEHDFRMLTAEEKFHDTDVLMRCAQLLRVEPPTR